jgi:hypothetical protein
MNIALDVRTSVCRGHFVVEPKFVKFSLKYKFLLLKNVQVFSVVREIKCWFLIICNNFSCYNSIIFFP